MSKPLIERLRRARETDVLSHGITFIVRRPTDLEVSLMTDAAAGQGVLQSALILNHVVGWKDVSELQLAPGGGPEPVAFEQALFAEYISDHPEHWDAIAAAVMEGYTRHRDKVEESLKNSPPGSPA